MSPYILCLSMYAAIDDKRYLCNKFWVTFIFVSYATCQSTHRSMRNIMYFDQIVEKFSSMDGMTLLRRRVGG